MFLNYPSEPNVGVGRGVPSIMDTILADETLLRRLTASSSSEDCVSALKQLNLDDDFWVYEFKVVPCAKSYSHKWTLCPCAHAGETARRRCPRTVNYKAVLCPLVKAKKTCPLGDACSYAHNVFEHWLHPSRYKTRLCSFGRNCNRPICFFAHSAEELRCVPQVDEGKEIDEKEYLLQLMLAQHDNNMLSSSLASNHNSGNQALHSLLQSVGSAPFAMSNLSTQQPSMSRSSSLRQAASVPLGGGLPPASAFEQSALLLNFQQQQQQQNQPGLLRGSLLDPSPMAPPPGRLSDPGTGGRLPALGQQVNPVPHLNRISDSGNTFGLVSQKDLSNSLESLLPLVNSALVGGHIRLPPSRMPSQLSAAAAAASQPPAMATSPIPISSMNSSSPPSDGSPHSASPSQSSAALETQHNPSSAPSSRAGSPTSSTSMPSTFASARSSGSSGNGMATNSAAAVLTAAAAVATQPGTAGALTESTVQSLLSQLQESGASKEQLVASLSQLLAQLLSVNS